eukprot:1152083-Pelagomonas_calceolata.AAC.3
MAGLLCFSKRGMSLIAVTTPAGMKRRVHASVTDQQPGDILKRVCAVRVALTTMSRSTQTVFKWLKHIEQICSTAACYGTRSRVSQIRQAFYTLQHASLTWQTIESWRRVQILSCDKISCLACQNLPSMSANALSMPSKKRAPKNATPMKFPV